MKPVERQGQQASIRGMFSAIAGHYDLMNNLMSLGQDNRWRTEALKLLQMKESGQLLDLACGSGEAALQAKRLYSDVQVFGMDLTLDMLRIATTKDKRQLVGWGAGDALSLPFADNTFDGLISAFLMRNVGDTRQALSEQVRVVRLGGRVVCLEMTMPEKSPILFLLKVYFFGWIPLLGKLLTGEAGAYRYLPKSVGGFIKPGELAAQMSEAGLVSVQWHTRMLGTVTIHVGEKPDW